MSQPPALVTGASGWLGARLVQALWQGLSDPGAFSESRPSRLIRGLVKTHTNPSRLKSLAGRAELVEGDVTDPSSLEPLFQGAAGGVVFHCAGLVHPRRWVRELYQVNAQGTANLVRAAVFHGIRRFIHVSSSSPFGYNPDPGRPFDESSPYGPRGHYGRSKELAEREVQAAGRSGAIEIVIVRPPWFYGPGQPARQTRFYSMIRRGTVPVVGTGANQRSMVYIDNLCQALLLAERTEAAGKTYWIADCRPYTMNEIIDTISRALQDEGISASSGRRRLPGFIGAAAEAGDLALGAAGFYRQELRVLAELGRDIFCSISRAQEELGYDPRVDLYQGTRRAIAWLQAEGIKI